MHKVYVDLTYRFAIMNLWPWRDASDALLATEPLSSNVFFIDGEKDVRNAWRFSIF